MSTLLHIDSSILGAHSVSRTLSASVVAQIRKSQPLLQVAYRDLAAAPIPHLSGGYLAAGQAPEGSRDAAVQADLALGRTVLEEFLAADIVVLGIGFYNFGIASQLKAWVDRICVIGKTFRYSEQGPQGLAGGKRVILAVARGGYYGPGTPAATLEHAESYLRGVFGFLGIADVDVVTAEGLAAGPEARQAGIAQAQGKIAALAA